MRLLAQGAAEILAEVRGAPAALSKDFNREAASRVSDRSRSRRSADSLPFTASIACAPPTSSSTTIWCRSGSCGEARRDAELIDVGTATPQPMAQEAISYLLAEKAREGKRVARLKWGDPFVFDRGAEEALFLHEQGVPFEVVPGIPAGIARTGVRRRARQLSRRRRHHHAASRLRRRQPRRCPMSIGRASPASTAPSCATQAPSN